MIYDRVARVNVIVSATIFVEVISQGHRSGCYAPPYTREMTLLKITCGMRVLFTLRDASGDLFCVLQSQR